VRHSNAAPQQYRSCGGLLQEDFLGSHTFFCPIAGNGRMPPLSDTWPRLGFVSIKQRFVFDFILHRG